MYSFIGIIIGLALFILLALRRYNLVLSAIASSCVLLLFSGRSPLGGLASLYMPGFARCVENYFLLFLLSALIGQLMSDGGSAKRIALSLASVVSRSKNKQQFLCILLVPALYFILCFVGISGFVVVFTVLPIAKDLFLQTNTPWRLYCCAGAQTISAAIMAGSLEAANVYAADVCGTSLSAGMLLSFIAVGVFTLVSLLMLWITFRQIQASGEGFLPSGAAIMDAAVDGGLSEDKLPSLPLSIFPLLLIVFLAAVLEWNVILVLFLGCVLTTVVCWKNLRNSFRSTLAQGTAVSFGPIINVSATYAIGVVIRDLEGFSLFQAMLGTLPDLLQGAGLGLLAAFIMGSITAPIPAFGPQMLEHFSNAALSAATSHRLILISCFTSIAPHNAGISNAASVLRLPYSTCLKGYMLYTYVPGVCAFLASCTVVALGIIR